MACETANPFIRYLDHWLLTPDGEPITTPTSRLLPVRCAAGPAMLKIARIGEEQIGNRLMTWWNGHGAARILAHDEHAILMERAEDDAGLADLSRAGGDDAASRTICAVVAALHSAPGEPAVALPSLVEWFAPLTRAARVHGGLLRVAAAMAADLLARQREVVVLHGDIHHGNILNFGTLGWLAIDPKGLIGDRAFDYANILCNPDHAIATTPGRLARQVNLIADAAGIERRRLLGWVLAWAGLSAAFSLDDGLTPDTALAVAELAAAELSR